MFTGIIQSVSEIAFISKKRDFHTHIVKMNEKMLRKLQIGSSVSYNGCCLTVSKIKENYVSFDLIKETLRLTNLGSSKIGDSINLERAAKLGEEIGGHRMTGHILCTAKILKHINREIWFELNNSEARRYIIYKGWIGLDGISLTIGQVIANKFCIYLIPETIRSTTLSKRKVSDYVNVEVDLQTKTVVDTVSRLFNLVRNA